jgi:competence protein ComFB
MSLSDRYHLEYLRNRTAEMVHKRVEQFLHEHREFCPCEQCVLDLLAYMLNHVDPMYGTSLLDPFDPDSAKEQRVRIQIDLALKAGARKVTETPNHNK